MAATSPSVRSFLLAWGAKVSLEFRNKALLISKQLLINPSDLMACIAFESDKTFSPSVVNGAGSGATGLIQFMPATAFALGTTTEELAKMTAEEQLDYVYAYFKPRSGRLQSLADVYMAILWPAAIGKPEDFVLFDSRDPKYPKRYIQNAGLDFDKNGVITKSEAAAKVLACLEEGLLPENSVRVFV